MLERRVHHIPDSYQQISTPWGGIWVDPLELELATTDALVAVTRGSVARVTGTLGHSLGRQLHVVVYGSTADAGEALGRDVPPTFLMAPFHGPESATIVLHSPRLDPRNADPARMSRHLCHEVSHVVTAERTGSTKRLGDGNVNMRVRPWVDEGFAVWVAARASAQPEALGNVLQQAVPADLAMTPDQVDQILCELDSPDRARAFALASAWVSHAVDRHGLAIVFSHLDAPDRWS